MYRVRCGCDEALFETLEEARAYAEKESWIQSLEAVIRMPDGKTQKIKVGNVP